jgi:glycosyltransferase involved in cell wall biosynthesis
MKVCVACYGRFHAFNLAEQLHEHGHLQSLVTGYPYFKVRSHAALPRQLVRPLPQVTAMCHLGRRLPKWLALGLDEEYGQARLWDLTVSRRLPAGIDILDTYAGMSLTTITKARERGIRVVLERGSSHRLFQMNILAEEHRRFGRAFHHDGRMMDAELQEYDAADRIAIPSGFVRRSFLEQGVSAGKLLQVPYGVNLARFRPEARHDDRFRIVFVGGFSLRKGVQYLLAAWQKLRLTDSELVFIGTQDPELLRHLGYQHVSNVRYAGPIPNAELRFSISQADVLVLPSIEEGLALVMPQAMACGVAVIHSANTGGADIVREGVDGYEVPIRDADALALRILQLHDDRDLARQMGRNALERVQGFGGWAEYGRRTIEGYRQLLGESGSLLTDGMR